MRGSISFWKRLLLDVLWIAGAIFFALFLAYLSSPNKQNWQWSTNAWALGVSAVVGFILGERRWIGRWVVNIVRAARILIREDENPEEFVFPHVDVEFFPVRHSGTNLDYIHLNIRWLNMLYRTATIEDVTGDFSLDGAIPADQFSQREPFKLKPHDWMKSETPIVVTIKHYNLESVTKMREAKRGHGALSVNLSFRLDGQLVKKTISDKYRYVD